MPRRVGVRPPRGAARLPPRAEPGPARREYLARRELQAGCGRRILRRSRQSRGRAASHAAPSPSRMAPARAATKASRSAPRRLLYHRRTPQHPAPGWSEPEKQRDLASPSTGPRPECRPGLPIPSGTQLASTGKSAFWIPLGFLSAKNQGQVWLNLGWLFPMNNNNDHNNNNHLWFFTVYKAPFPVISSTLSKPGQEGNSILSSPL